MKSEGKMLKLLHGCNISRTIKGKGMNDIISLIEVLMMMMMKKENVIFKYTLTHENC